MKKFFVCLFAAFALLTTSCSKDDDDNSPANKASVTISGKTYSFNDLSWIDAEFNGVKTYSITSFSEDDNADEISINLSSNKTGEISVDAKNSITIKVGQDTYKSTSGKFTITTFDSKYINGSFKASFKKGTDATIYNIEGSFVSKIFNLLDLV